MTGREAASHHTWRDQTRQITDRAIELIREDRRRGDGNSLAEAVGSQPRRGTSQLRMPRPEYEVRTEVAEGDQRAVRMVQTDDWPPITMPGTGRIEDITDH